MARTSTARKGATHASRADLNPLHLVQEVKTRYPEAANDEVIRRVRKLLATTRAVYQEAFDSYAIHNLIRTIERDQEIARSGGVKVVTPFATGGKGGENKAGAPAVEPKPAVRDPEQVEAERHTAELDRIARTKTAMSNILRVAILDLKSPDGRLYRLLPIEDFIGLGNRQAAFGRKLLKEGHKPTELLGTATTNEALANAVNGQ